MGYPPRDRSVKLASAHDTWLKVTVMPAVYKFDSYSLIEQDIFKATENESLWPFAVKTASLPVADGKDGFAFFIDGFELSKMQLMVDLLGERLNLLMCPLIII